MKLNIAICDDLKAAQLQLDSFIRAYCAERSLEVSVKLFSSGEELLDALRPGMFHILFLDIYMNELDGVQTARVIRKTDQTCAIIFSTTSEDHGLVSYEVQASDYLVKPIKQEDVDSAMDWCVEQIRSTYRMLTVACETGAVTLPLRDIMYIEIQGHTACLHTADRGGVLTTRRGLDELEQEIRHPDFIRCHRSFLVNMNHVRWLERNAFLLYNGETVPIGSTMVAKVKDQFMGWFFAKTWANK